MKKIQRDQFNHRKTHNKKRFNPKPSSQNWATEIAGDDHPDGAHYLEDHPTDVSG